MILATKVQGVDERGRVIQSASSTQPAGAVLADADLGLGRPNGIYRAHLLHVENQHRAGLPVPSPSDGRDLAIDPATVDPFLKYQASLHTEQRFLLAESQNLFPYPGAQREPRRATTERVRARADEMDGSS